MMRPLDVGLEDEQRGALASPCGQGRGMNGGRHHGDAAGVMSELLSRGEIERLSR